MIKLRVEWHHTCPDCGTCTVVDFLADPHGYKVCPWCGRVAANPQPTDNSALRNRVAEAVRTLEQRTNSSLAAI